MSQAMPILLLLGLLYLVPATTLYAWRMRREVVRYRYYGLGAAGVMLAGNLVALWVDPTTLPPGRSPLILDSAGAALFTVVGMHCAESLGLRSFQVIGTGDRPKPWRWISGVGVVGLGLAAYSSLWFRTINAFLSLAPDASEAGFNDVIAVTLGPIKEEIVFRLGAQNFLAKRFRWSGRRYWIAVALSSALFSLLHLEYDPAWVKILQILPFGFVLGWLFKRHGIESCIVAHALCNGVLMLPRVGL